LCEFEVELDESVAVHVWDSSADQRYMVLPERPAGTEQLSEDELAALVTRDAMIGVAKVNAPALAVG
jgi:nitrile hydratase